MTRLVVPCSDARARESRANCTARGAGAGVRHLHVSRRARDAVDACRAQARDAEDEVSRCESALTRRASRALCLWRPADDESIWGEMRCECCDCDVRLGLWLAWRGGELAILEARRRRGASPRRRCPRCRCRSSKPWRPRPRPSHTPLIRLAPSTPSQPRIHHLSLLSLEHSTARAHGSQRRFCLPDRCAAPAATAAPWARPSWRCCVGWPQRPAGNRSTARPARPGTQRRRRLRRRPPVLLLLPSPSSPARRAAGGRAPHQPHHQQHHHPTSSNTAPTRKSPRQQAKEAPPPASRS